MKFTINCLNPNGSISHLHEPSAVHALMDDMDSWSEQEPEFKQSFIDNGMPLLTDMSAAYLLLPDCTDEVLATLVGFKKERYNQTSDPSLVYAIKNFYEIYKRHLDKIIFYRIKYEYNKSNRTFYYKIDYNLADESQSRKFFISTLLPEL